MTDVVHLADRSDGDARRYSVEHMLRRALEELHTPDPAAPDAKAVRAVLVIDYAAGGDRHIIGTSAAGVDLISAIGLLEAGKLELAMEESDRAP